jgi:hypothetical protein
VYLVVCSAAAAPLPAAAAALVVREQTVAMVLPVAQDLPQYLPVSVCQCHQCLAMLLMLLPVLLLLR